MLFTGYSTCLAPTGRLAGLGYTGLAPNGCIGGSWVGRADEHRRWRRFRVWWGETHLALDRRDAHVVEAEAERDADVLKHLPRLPQRLRQRDGRPQELDAALEVRVAALLLGERGRRQHHGGAIPLRSRQVIPGGQEPHR